MGIFRIKAHVERVGRRSGPAKLAEATLSTRRWWEVNIPGYHRDPSALYTTLLYGEWLDSEALPVSWGLPVLTPNDMVWDPSSAHGVMKRMQLWFGSQNICHLRDLEPITSSELQCPYL